MTAPAALAPETIAPADEGQPFTPPPGRAFSLEGFTGDAARTIIQEFANGAATPEERTEWALRWYDVAPDPTPAVDPAAPIGLSPDAIESKINQLLGPLAKDEGPRIAAILSDPDLQGKAGAPIRERKLAALVPIREKAVRQTVESFVKWVQGAEADNALKLMPFDATEIALSEMASRALRDWLPADFVRFAEQHVSADRAVAADVFRPMFRRIAVNPPNHWTKDPASDAAARVIRLEQIMPLGKREAAALRAERAKAAGLEARQRFTRAAGTFVATGRLG